MTAINSILENMIKNELSNKDVFVVSHHCSENPQRIDIARDETAFIYSIFIEANSDFWLEFHSATASRFIEKQTSTLQVFTDEIISRHKGNIYFSSSAPFNFKVNYVKIKIIK